MQIRTAEISDAERLLAIYRPYVMDTAITFEYEVPSIEEFAARIQAVLVQYPYLVAENHGEIVGYAYASPFKERAAYDWAVETSIYVKKECRGNGYGRKLYAALEEKLKAQNILNVNACIAYTETEDETLTNHSMYFHESLGYILVGRFHKCGYKFNRWYDMIWMEKTLGSHNSAPKKVIPYSVLGDQSIGSKK